MPINLSVHAPDIVNAHEKLQHSLSSSLSLSQTVAVLCDRNAIEIKRYGHPMGFPKTPKMALVQAVCGRGLLLQSWQSIRDFPSL